MSLRQYEICRDYILWMKHHAREKLLEIKSRFDIADQMKGQIEKEQRRRIRELEKLEQALSSEIDRLREAQE